VNWYDKLLHQTLGIPFRLSYKTYGGQGRDVVLLHGIASDGLFWLPLVQKLEATSDYRIIVPDLLGHGASPTPQYINYSVEDQTNALQHLLRRLQVNEAILVGHSMGCLVASRFAHQHQNRTSQLLLYEPPLFTDVPGFETAGKRRNFYKRLYERIAENPSGKVTTTRVVAGVSKNWQQYLKTDQTWLPIQRSLRNTILQQRSYEELKDITIRTDIVHGRLDLVVPPIRLRRRLASNNNINFYRTTDRHRLSHASARTLVRIITADNNHSTSKKGKI
jgi:pimeloyl-ACP methyl ester carboxylesterase